MNPQILQAIEQVLLQTAQDQALNNDIKASSIAQLANAYKAIAEIAPPPNPEQELQMEQARFQMEAQKAEQSLAIERQKAELTLQLEQQRFQIEVAKTQQQLEHQENAHQQRIRQQEEVHTIKQQQAALAPTSNTKK